MFNAISTGDKEAAEKLFARDYITINADGIMQEKEETMKQRFRNNIFQKELFQHQVYKNANQY
jgi:hypothetical protein